MRIEAIHRGLTSRLLARRAEIEQAILTRVNAVADPSEAKDPLYVEGLRAAVGASIDHGIETLRHSRDSEPVPIVLLAQARLAARMGVSLDAVLRRYFAGHAVFADFVIEEAEQLDPPPRGAALQRLMRTQATLFDRMVDAVSEEYRREATRPGSSAERLAQRVERLLDGELVDADDLRYDLGGRHLGLAAVGEGAAEAIRELADGFDCRLLLVSRDDGMTWAWFGARDGIDPTELAQRAAPSLRASIFLAIGEPAEGLTGWRFTHQQARAALAISVRGSETIVRYSDVALLASILQDDLLARSLREIYLSPLGQGPQGELMRETLRAYFAADRNTSSAAAALGVSRQTVTKRIRAVEAILGRPLGQCGMELEATLRLDGLSRATGVHPRLTADCR